jgi:hypothetical protein
MPSRKLGAYRAKTAVPRVDTYDLRHGVGVASGNLSERISAVLDKDHGSGISLPLRPEVVSALPTLTGGGSSSGASVDASVVHRKLMLRRAASAQRLLTSSGGGDSSAGRGTTRAPLPRAHAGHSAQQPHRPAPPSTIRRPATSSHASSAVESARVEQYETWRELEAAHGGKRASTANQRKVCVGGGGAHCSWTLYFEIVYELTYLATAHCTPTSHAVSTPGRCG